MRGIRCDGRVSLGDHMKVHLTQIAETTDGIQSECNDDDENDHPFKDSCINQSNIVLIIEEHFNVEEFRGGDQSNNRYELRENLAIFWRISDPKHVVLANTVNACRECSKEFSSLRALAGPMRPHAIKMNKKVRLCEEWGREFEAMRAKFGHTKSHKRRVTKVSNIVEFGEKLSDLENFCPIRRTRFMIKYMDTFNSSAKDSDNSAYIEGAVAACGNGGDFAENALFVTLDVTFDDAEMLRIEHGIEFHLDLGCADGCLENGKGIPSKRGFHGFIVIAKNVFEEVWNNMSCVAPIRALEERTVLTGGLPQAQWLVQWSNDPDSPPSWEPKVELLCHIPNLSLEDKAIVMGGGVDRDSEHGRPTTSLSPADRGDQPKTKQTNIKPAQEEEVIQQMKTKQDRPKRNVSKPACYKDCRPR